MTIDSFYSVVRELDASRDENLTSYLVTTQAMERLSDLKSDAIVGIGIKGSGKSAAYKYLSRSTSDKPSFIIGIDPANHEVVNYDRKRSCRGYIPYLENDIVFLVLSSLYENRQQLQKKVGEAIYTMTFSHD